VTRWLIIIVPLQPCSPAGGFGGNYQLYGEWFATDTHLNLAGRADISLAEAWESAHEANAPTGLLLAGARFAHPNGSIGCLFWFSRIGLVGLCLAIVGRLAQYPKTRPLPLKFRIHRLIESLFTTVGRPESGALFALVMEVGSVSHTRLMFPAHCRHFAAAGPGLARPDTRRLAAWFSGGVAALLLAINLYSLGWLLYPAFKPPQIAPANTFINFIPHPLPAINLTFLDSLKLVGGQVYKQHD